MPRGSPWWHRKFRGYGYRVTIPREAILDVLSKTSEHLSAEDVYMAVHKVYPAVGLTTIYRTLELLTRMGFVFKFDFGGGRSRYELAEGPNTKHHHHLVCNKCNRIIDYSDFIDKEVELLKHTEKGLSKKYNFKIDSHQISFMGVCNNCQ
ncbi:MAG: transcriptional repressor [Candidatus Omnitrophica bacterium]|nr:transcriptional repressor [Candidatus Omnitrophota bacterium]MCK4423639.1 transcriptional repressor [Candidatus Omnitrophota bacterium]